MIGRTRIGYRQTKNLETTWRGQQLIPYLAFNGDILNNLESFKIISRIYR